jgi:hypothetical protein
MTTRAKSLHWNVLEFISPQEDLYLYHLEPCRFGDTTPVVFDPS